VEDATTLSWSSAAVSEWSEWYDRSTAVRAGTTEAVVFVR